MSVEWQSLVKTIAPVLGGSLGGPFGAMAAKWLSGKVLGDENASEDDLAQYISTANPEQLAQIKALEQDFKVEMKRLGLQEKQLEVQDRESTRELAKVNIWPQVVLSAAYVLGYFSVLILLLTGHLKIDSESQPLVLLLIGVMTAAVTSIMQFWFGSSQGSKEKTIHLADK